MFYGRNGGFHITFANGNTVSVQFGAGNYISERSSEDFFRTKPATSVDAECAAWDKNNVWYRLGENDDVIGWQTPAQVLELLNKAEKGELRHG